MPGAGAAPQYGRNLWVSPDVQFHPTQQTLLAATPKHDDRARIPRCAPGSPYPCPTGNSRVLTRLSMAGLDRGPSG